MSLFKSRVRHKERTRKKIIARSNRPRLAIFRSNKYVYAQIIDTDGKIIAAASEKELKKTEKETKLERAKLVGELVAEKALSKKLKKVAFDRSGYRYHGRVKALAEGARGKGLII
ncbi:50S ribosomal protein L18 [Candidatus Microgenomates bacterium]|nr:50S ribosomal protein L18 [Candidatus Microgenomates bacterium]